MEGTTAITSGVSTVIDLVGQVGDHQLTGWVDHQQRARPALVADGDGRRLRAKMPGPLVLALTPPAQAPVAHLRALGGGEQVDHRLREEAVLAPAAGQHQVPQLRHVPGAGILTIRRQAGAVDVVGVFQSQFLRPPVHQRREAVLCPGDVFRQGHRPIVGRSDDRGFQDVFQRVSRVSVQERLGPGLPRRRGRNRDLVLQGNAALVQLFQHQ